MKKLFLTLFAATMSLAAMAQTDIWYWQNGMTTKIESVDSITFAKPPVGSTKKYVDLGLSVKWATCNVGVEKPEEYGVYFAWGETKPKTDYRSSTYKFTTDGGKTFTKYTGSDKTVLDAEDDAAAANWGGAWRMPTLEEVQELLNNCTWYWQAAGNTEFGGVAGYKVKSRISGYTDKYIFLPAAGYRTGTSLLDTGTKGCYWSAMLYTGNSAEEAYHLRFVKGDWIWYHNYRVVGQTVRPVCP